MMPHEDFRNDTLRRKSLGELGELFAIKALVDNSFEKIVNLNDNKMNYLFADLYAGKDGKKYVVSIKARNKYQKNNEINAFYKLGNKAYEKARSAESEFQAKAYWMAIQFDERTFTIYFGSLDELNNRNAISIRECEERKIGICFVKDKRHYFDFGYFTNKKDKKTHNKGLHEDRRKKRGDL